MNYRRFGKTGLEVSALGFGCMRFPTKQDGEKEVIDEERAIAMVRQAIDAGVNYIDTAYFYHEGQSEPMVGKALLDGYRDRVCLATKSPVWLLEKESDFDRILDEQMEKLQTDRIDFYLLHALSRETFEKAKALHVMDYLKKAKASGKVRYIGFSFHDDYETFKDIIDYMDDWDFCQIQYNYVDVEHQAGRKGLQYAASKGLGVVIMEPLRGGRLANIAAHHAEVFPREKTPVEWTLDFLWDQPEVSVVLSGMSTEEQVKDNLLYAARAEAGMLSDSEREIFVKAKEVFDTMAMVRCTGCAYCMPCPAGLDIPGIFSIYNKIPTEGKEKAKELYDKQSVKADECLRCLQCEHVCPQHIGVSSVMTDISEEFE